MSFRTLLLILSFLTLNCAYASTTQVALAQFGRVLIEIPTGFGRVNHTPPKKHSKLDVYVSNKDLPPTLFQLNEIVIPEGPSNLSEERQYEAAANFLVGFLRAFKDGGVTDWSRTAVEPVRLGGYNAAKARWTGIFHGIPNEGVMYILVLGKESYCLHAFGSAGPTNALLKSSVGAIEKLKLVETLQ